MTIPGTGTADKGWNHGTRKEFFDYYAAESETAATVQRFGGIQKQVLRVATRQRLPARLEVLDVGCGAGTQSLLWARLGHDVRGIDVNEALVALARQRSLEQGLATQFELGSATALPWPDDSMDVCLLPELLEHVADWKQCLREAARVVKPGGLLFVSTTNVLCPVQQEFNLPLYSWYPAVLKRHFERLAVTTRPDLANHATYPAVHWFSFYQLREFLAPLGLGQCLDRFDLIDPAEKGSKHRAVLSLLQRSSLLRFLAHVATPATGILAIKVPC